MKQIGRSMIEMLGVLAIIGVLSIGGIVLYRRAVNNHHANTILDDVNRFAFVIIEKGNYPLGDVIPKSDFKESGIYTLEGYQDVEANQFSITVADVPKGVCEPLLDKATTQYKVRVNPNANEKGKLYDTLNRELCINDTNVMVFYFGDTTDLCNPKEDGYTPCTENSDCCGGEFCLLPGWPGDPPPQKQEPNGNGECRELKGDYLPQTFTLPNAQVWFRDSGLGLNWWSAQNWCATLGKKMATREEIGCPSLKDAYCTSNGEEGLAKEGTVLRALQDHGWTGMYWLGEKAYNYGSFTVHFGRTNLPSLISTAGWSRGRHPLCH